MEPASPANYRPSIYSLIEEDIRNHVSVVPTHRIRPVSLYSDQTCPSNDKVAIDSSPLPFVSTTVSELKRDFPNLDCLASVANILQNEPTPLLSSAPSCTNEDCVPVPHPYPPPSKRQRCSSRLRSPELKSRRDLLTCSFEETEFEDLLVSIANQRTKPGERINYSSAPLKVDLPPHLNVFLDADLSRLEYIHSQHRLPCVSWSSVKFDMEAHLACLFARPVKVFMLDVSLDNSFDVEEICLDEIMRSTNSGAVVVHGKSMCYVSTLSQDLCDEVVTSFSLSLGIIVEPADLVLHGIRMLGNAEKKKEVKKTVHFANFGCSVYPQSPMKADSSRNQMVIEAMGGNRGGRFKVPGTAGVNVNELVGEIYRSDFRPYFDEAFVEKEDRFYSQSQSGAKRFSKSLCALTTIEMPYTLLNSMPLILKNRRAVMLTAKDHLSFIAAAQWETQFRQLSEIILSHVFAPLPYAMTGELCADRFSKATKKMQEAGLDCCFLGHDRALPKGATGVQLHKELHDDSNASVIPGIWSSVTASDELLRTKLRFAGRGLNVSMFASKRRFAMFYGWIPHKTEGEDKAPNRSQGKMIGASRVHHSAFSKVEMEFLAFSLFRADTLNSVIEHGTQL